MLRTDENPTGLMVRHVGRRWGIPQLTWSIVWPKSLCETRAVDKYTSKDASTYIEASYYCTYLCAYTQNLPTVKSFTPHLSEHPRRVGNTSLGLDAHKT